MTIFFDVDGVLADTAQFACDLMWWRYSMNMTPAMITSVDSAMSGIITEVANDRRLNQYIKPINGAQGGVNWIAAHHPICFLTARPMSSNTSAWLMDHFDVRIRTIYTDEKWREGKRPGDMLIDDNLEQCGAWAATGRVAILFDQPWNQAEELPERVVRCKGWNAVEKAVGK